ncbi:hypothetical protein Pelo_3187 [Pelomyxa schiedti]|nr:hypothetical protein Pelo_3187 [Pelomyxa schiedti]
MHPSGGKPAVDNGKKKQRGRPPKKRQPVQTLFAPSSESSSSSQSSPTTSATTTTPTFTLAHPLVSSENENTATTSGQSSPTTTTFATTPNFTFAPLNVAPENAMAATGKLSNTTADLFNNNNNVDFNTSGGIINGEKETQQEEDEHHEISREQQRNDGTEQGDRAKTVTTSTTFSGQIQFTRSGGAIFGSGGSFGFDDGGKDKDNDKIPAGMFQPIFGGKEKIPGGLFDQIPSVPPPFFGSQTGAPSQQSSGSIVFSDPSTSLDTSTFGSSSLPDLYAWGSRPTQDAEDSVFTSPGSLKPSTQCTATVGSNASAFPLTQEPQIPSAKCDGTNTPLSPSSSTLEVPAPSSNGTEDSQNNLESTDDVHMVDEAPASITAISSTTETQQTSEQSETSPQPPSAQLNATQEPVPEQLESNISTSHLCAPSTPSKSSKQQDSATVLSSPLPPVIEPLSPQCTLPASPSHDTQNLSLSHNNTSTTSNLVNTTNASGHNWDNTLEHQRSTEFGNEEYTSGPTSCQGSNTSPDPELLCRLDNITQTLGTLFEEVRELKTAQNQPHSELSPPHQEEDMGQVEKRLNQLLEPLKQQQKQQNEAFSSQLRDTNQMIETMHHHIQATVSAMVELSKAQKEIKDELKRITTEQTHRRRQKDLKELQCQAQLISAISNSYQESSHERLDTSDLMDQIKLMNASANRELSGALSAVIKQQVQNEVTEMRMQLISDLTPLLQHVPDTFSVSHTQGSPTYGGSLDKLSQDVATLANKTDTMGQQVEDLRQLFSRVESKLTNAGLSPESAKASTAITDLSGLATQLQKHLFDNTWCVCGVCQKMHSQLRDVIGEMELFLKRMLQRDQVPKQELETLLTKTREKLRELRGLSVQINNHAQQQQQTEEQH